MSQSTLPPSIQSSRLYSADLAPVPPQERTWNRWHLAALWVGMAVCIPTYILASYMIRAGLSWQAALGIIAVANLIITVPMVLNGHGGVKYGLPFPVLGRAPFGTRGIHLPSIVRAIVACGWFGVQTWVGGLAIYAIWNAITGNEAAIGLSLGKFVSFGVFWLINIYFIWAGTESIKWLENFSAPFLILVGFLMIGWAWNEVGSFSKVLDQGAQLSKPAAILQGPDLFLTGLKNEKGELKAQQVRVFDAKGNIEALDNTGWIPTASRWIPEWQTYMVNSYGADEVKIQYRSPKPEGGYTQTEIKTVRHSDDHSFMDLGSTLWQYLLWLTAMVGFWATMSLSISDITKHAKSQGDQVAGQFLGLPGTMVLYSFVGIFVTCATVLLFPDLLIADDAPWDPVSFLTRFKNPWVVVISQLAMLVATLSTNIAANVIAPANAFANLFPKQISFRVGGVIAGLIGIIICPWWLMDDIGSILTFISGLLGPVLGIMLCDYFTLRKTRLNVPDLYREDGQYAYGGSGFNPAAMVALALGVGVALVGHWVPALDFLYTLSWFTGFGVAYVAYYFLGRKAIQNTVNQPDLTPDLNAVPAS